MSVAGIIPARYASTRLPGKALANLCGKLLIQHVYERTARAETLDEVIVATDDERILEAVRSFGGRAEMTSPEHRSGTDRIAEVAARLDADIIANIQGDEPLIEPKMIDTAVRALLEDKSVEMSTLKSLIHDEKDITNPNVVKVVTDLSGYALYFSRLPIPYCRDPRQSGPVRHYRHIGLYAYRRSLLLRYPHLPQTPLEQLEMLEQLRALENGCRIRVAETDFESLGVDTREELERVRRILEGD
ncbi:MAG: 3-deoxy-manno-octulosonate cytidylyltransferase [Armatimonadetes bacterium]|nr:3-deoxy-manno-octulosonate cytidylyltransferase [Armatimonadota bacterium]